MGKKKKDVKPHRELTKRQLSHWEKEKKRQRIIFITGIVLIAIVICVTLGGWIFTSYLPLRQVVLKINQKEFTLGYYIDMLKLYAGNNAAGMADNVLKVIEQNELIKEETGKLGITVSDEEVKKELASRKPPLSKKYADPIRAQLLMNKMDTEYFDKQMPASVEQRQIMAMLLESESQATQVKKRLENGEDFSKLAEELSLEQYSKAQKGDFGWRPKGVLPLAFNTTKLEDYVFSAEVGKVSDPVFDPDQSKTVGYWLLRVLERKDDPKEAHIQGIMLGGEEQAKKVKERLDAGESFGTLAKELSLDTNSKDAEGEMGWIPQDYADKAVAGFAFDTSIELKKLSDPIRDDTISTKGGYWLIKVTGIEADRKLDDENRNLLKSKLKTDWVDGLWDNPAYKIEDLLNPDLKQFAIQQALKGK